MQQYAHAFFPAEVWLTHNNMVHMKCKRNHNCRITILQLKRFLVITVTLSYCVSSFSGGFGNFNLLMKYLSLSTYWRYYFEKKKCLWNISPPNFSCLQLAETYGPVFSVKRGSERMVYVAGYKMVKEALVNQLDSFIDRPVLPLFHIIYKGLGEYRGIKV